MKLFEQPHPEQERSYNELRTEFRSKALAYIRSRYSQRHPKGWNMIREELDRRGFTPEGWAVQMLKRLDAPVRQDFGLEETPESLSKKLHEQAVAALEHDSVTWADGVEGVVDHDAAPLPPIDRMTDDQLCNYVAREIERSKDGPAR